MVDCRSIVVDRGAKCYEAGYTMDDRNNTNTIFVKMVNSSNPMNIYASRDFYKVVWRKIIFSLNDCIPIFSNGNYRYHMRNESHRNILRLNMK